MRKSRRALLVLALVAALGVGGYFVYQNISFQSQLAGFEAGATSFIFHVYDEATGKLMDDDDFTIYLYSADISDLTQDEISALTFSDYSLVKTLGQGGSYTPDNDSIYLFKVNGSDISTYWGIPMLGDNDIYTYNLTEDVAMAALSKNSLSTQVANTTEKEWTIFTQTLDGPEGNGTATDREGFKVTYDYEADDWNLFMIMITFNDTADYGYAKMTDIEADTLIVGNQLYLLIKSDVIGFQEWHLKLGDEVGYNDGSAVSVESITVGYTLGGTPYGWDLV